MPDLTKEIIVSVSALGTLIIPGQALPDGSHRYIRGSDFDRVLAQRDKLLDVAKAMMPNSTTIDVNRARVAALRDAIAECEESQ